MAVAAADAAADQPFAELGLLPEEYDRIRALLGRRPTGTELAMYAVMWSEHCSYKSSRVHLRRFADLPSAGLLAGIGANAGVVDVGEGLAVTFKVESHNHPSFVEPYQGAATGVGGIIRDILAMGARPVALLDPLRFGPAEAPDTRRLLPGVVAGIAGYGNCVGVPTVGGELVFDPGYEGNPLVNVLCVGVLPADRLQRAEARGPGNAVVLLGARTGRDGIGGVSVLASATFEAGGGPARRPSVQVGDPFAGKCLVECCLELYDRRLVLGVQDLGGAGLACGLSETAAAGGTGMAVELDRVPLREPSMQPWEVVTSESQERMVVVVAPDDVPAVLATARHWGVPAAVIGTVTAEPRLRLTWHGDLVADVPPASLADEGPVYHRPLAPGPARAERLADDPARLARPSTGAQLRAALLRLVADPNQCARDWVSDQYDRYVLGATVSAMPEDAGVLRLDDGHRLGVAVATDGNARYSALDPYAGAALALAEAHRNVAVTGARPVAVTDCLNFGSPEDPAVMWDFAETVRGLADACRALSLPVTGGNVSFYNSTGSAAVPPTPVVGVLGVIADVGRRVGAGFRRSGDAVLLLGETRDELGGSAWAAVCHGHLGGRPPAVDLAAERRLAGVLAAAAERGLLAAAHDVSAGGLAQTLAESCLRHGVGVSLELGTDPFVELFSESVARAVVAVAPDAVAELTELAAGYPCRWLGTTGGDALAVREHFVVPLAELGRAHRDTLPALFD